MRPVLSFAVAYRRARSVELLPRSLCACGCARTLSARDFCCWYTHKPTGELRVYASRECLFAHVGGVE